MKLARLRNKSILHVTADGIRTGCGALIPETATVTRSTDEWYLHSNCYNCAYRLWPDHGPADYVRPRDSKDFPPRRKCEHDRDPKMCTTCTPPPPRKPTNWPCPNGCTDPADHMYFKGWSWRTRCTVFPPRNPLDSEGRCVGVCEPYDSAVHRANPKLNLDLSDSSHMYCYHCDHDIDFGRDAEGTC